MSIFFYISKKIIRKKDALKTVYFLNMEKDNYPNTRLKKRKGEDLEKPRKRKKIESLEKSENDKNSSDINMGKHNPSDLEKKNIIELNIEQLSDIFSKKTNKKKNKRVNLTEKSLEKSKKIKKESEQPKNENSLDEEKMKSIKECGGYYDENDEFIIPDNLSELMDDSPQSDMVLDLEEEIDEKTFSKIKFDKKNKKNGKNEKKEPNYKDLGLTKDEFELMTEEEFEYWKKISKKERKLIKKLEKELEEYDKEEVPERFRLIKSSIDLHNKKNIMQKMMQLEMMEPSDPEYFKLNKWVEGSLKIPFGKFHSLPVNKDSQLPEIQEYLKNVNETMNNSTYGHEETKDKIMQVVCQWISNPQSCGNIIALDGPPGIGKTSLVRNGIAKALGRPFKMIALGGATDSTFLEGHNYTYEGSTWGRIASILMESRCMNPVIFFDELDKVSATKNGEEIIGVLTHLTDMTQNSNFNDKYFSGIDLDLSKCLFVFSYNDENLINPVLKDRLLKIKLQGFKTPDKIKIGKDYLIPELLENIGLKKDEICIEEDNIKHIIEKYTSEEGVRELRRCLETLFLKINKAKYLKDDNIKLPCHINNDLIDKLLKKTEKESIFRNEGAKMMYL